MQGCRDAGMQGYRDTVRVRLRAVRLPHALIVVIVVVVVVAAGGPLLMLLLLTVVAHTTATAAGEASARLRRRSAAGEACEPPRRACVSLPRLPQLLAHPARHLARRLPHGRQAGR